MNPIFAAALEVQAFCRAKRWKFCVELKDAPDAAARLRVVLARARDQSGS